VDKTNSRVAGFDIDGTLIQTKSGKRYPRDENDWVFFNKHVITEIKRLYKDNYRIIFISNQKGMSSGSTNVDQWKAKLDQITSQIKVPVEIYAATSSDMYRKPMTGMWDKCVVNFDTDTSFYVGDMAGRKGDPYDSDRKLALNLGIQFYTPEEFFT
jgi:bifunctional polynucleotide phosphatase/kinase